MILSSHFSVHTHTHTHTHRHTRGQSIVAAIKLHVMKPKGLHLDYNNSLLDYTLSSID
jgi:hypothetical protein